MSKITESEGSTQVNIWDIPTRIFHWTLVLAIFGCWFSMEIRWLEVHRYIGYFVLFLLVYRFIWGVIGSTTTRFSYFVSSPRRATSYFFRSFKNNEFHPGHNPAGGWMVLVFLVLISAQIATGLFANDDLGFSGPMADWVVKDLSDLLTQFHLSLFNILLVLIWIHVVMVYFYVVVKGQNLVKAMITGKKPISQTGESLGLSFASFKTLLITFVLAVSLPIWLIFW